jgi:LDH2 family malate/lactate/ureidoglycolate dehydrogenase
MVELEVTAETMVSLPDFEAAIQLMLQDAGMAASDARVAGLVLVRTTARGFVSHGVRLLPMYLDWMKRGIVDPRAQPTDRQTGPCHAIIDGRDALGQIVAHRATDKAIELAAGGLAVVGARHSTHFGAGSHYALTCAEAGFVGLVWSSTPAVMSAPGSRGPVVGNGPTAYGIPRHEGPPVVYDAAMSEAAGSKVMIAIQRGEPVPDGWIVDADGRFTTDPNRRAALAPMGGHKGFALALLGEILAGALTGAGTAESIPSMNKPVTRQLDIGHLIVAIDPAIFGAREHFDQSVEALMSFVIGAPTVEGLDHIRIPGEQAAGREREARRSGLPVATETLEMLFAAAESKRAVDALRASSTAVSPDGAVASWPGQEEG